MTQYQKIDDIKYVEILYRLGKDVSKLLEKLAEARLLHPGRIDGLDPHDYGFGEYEGFFMEIARYSGDFIDVLRIIRESGYRVTSIAFNVEFDLNTKGPRVFIE